MEISLESCYTHSVASATVERKPIESSESVFNRLAVSAAAKSRFQAPDAKPVATGAMLRVSGSGAHDSIKRLTIARATQEF